MKTNKSLQVIALSLIGLLGLGGGVAYASDSAVPGDLLYPIDLAIENAQMALTNDPAEQAELAQEILDERIEELEEIANDDDKGQEDIEKANKEVDKARANAYGKTEEMLQARIDGNVSEVVHTRVLLKQEENAERHEVKLQEVKTKVEEKLIDKEESKTNKKLGKTIEKSNKGKNKQKMPLRK